MSSFISLIPSINTFSEFSEKENYENIISPEVLKKIDKPLVDILL
jgi:hypothetical protein